LASNEVCVQTNFELALNMKDTRSLFQGYQQLTSQIQTAKQEWRWNRFQNPIWKKCTEDVHTLHVMIC